MEALQQSTVGIQFQGIMIVVIIVIIIIIIIISEAVELGRFPLVLSVQRDSQIQLTLSDTVRQLIQKLMIIAAGDPLPKGRVRSAYVVEVEVACHYM